MVNTEQTKNLKRIFFEFFGMRENWKWKRNILGLLMVHAPEYPTYLIPAYTQAKATGNAKELKKGEGLRGFLTGMLEGLAVGALVSGEKLKIKEMIPFIVLGAGLQFFSSQFFPWAAEKVGKHIYLKNRKKSISKQITNISNNKIKPVFQNFKGQNIYPKNSIKI
ncbi:MAG TPA: hypothetical protein PLG15_01615 [Candidatus Gastranaerophilaceae bacterium]|nr:hypothetical protein [Candidatus Gastranaerophilaceae bacterium]HPT41062.1 hypothetical protein [Candidatus Gastranaerophilaceae bacterium]